MTELTKKIGMNLSERIRPDCEAAPWVIKEVKELEQKLAIAVEALEFYAKGKTNSNEAQHGERMEFGCGCCAGVYDSENGTDYDSDVIGQTAREALAKIRGGE